MPINTASANLQGQGLFSATDWERLADSLKLSPREVDIVRGVLDDRTNAAIADRLRISPHTVHTHLGRLYQKLNVRSRVELVVRIFGEYLLMKGLVPNDRRQLDTHSPPLACPSSWELPAPQSAVN